LVLPAKVFEMSEEPDFEVMVQRLKDFREEEPYQMENEGTIELVTEILDLELQGETVFGVFSRDFVRRRYYRRKLVEAPVTEEAPFWIKRFQGRAFLIVLAPSVARGVKKLLTNHVANELSKILFVGPGAIVEVNISHETLKEFHESNPQATKLIWFDNVDIPSVDKLCLAGFGLADTRLYQDYLGHGNIWYVVFEVQKRGIVVGITRNCVITLFSKSTVSEFIDYIVEGILTLIE
jgi:hypothetical protein